MNHVQPDHSPAEHSEPWPPRGLWISMIISLIILLSSVGIILWVYKDHPDLPTEVAIIMSLVISIVGTEFGLCQWLFPREGHEKPATQKLTHTPLLSHSQTQAPLPSTPVLPALPAPSSPPTSTPATTPATQSQERELLSPDASFPLAVKLPRASEFFGRDNFRETLINRCHQQASTSIIGPRRIGKTWMLQYLLAATRIKLGSRFKIGYLDATSPKCSSSVASFTAEAIRVLDPTTFKTLNLDSTSGKSLNLNLSLIDLENFVAEALKKRQPPILCIDEFEGLRLEQGFDLNFFVGMRSLAQAGLVLVVVSKNSLIDIVGDPDNTSGFFNIFEQIRLSPFTQSEAEQFVAAKARQVGFSPLEQEKLFHYGQSEEHEWPPLRLQLVGKRLLEDINSAKKGSADAYLPDNQDYWRRFESRIDEAYRALVR